MTSADNDNAPAGGGQKCPVCGRPAEKAYNPFCGKRCADIDLNRWLTGAYAIPAVEDDGDAEEGEAE